MQQNNLTKILLTNGNFQEYFYRKNLWHFPSEYFTNIHGYLEKSIGTNVIKKG